MNASNPTDDITGFNPQVHLSFTLSFNEREQLKQIAIAQGRTVEQLLQKQVRDLLAAESSAGRNEP